MDGSFWLVCEFVLFLALLFWLFAGGFACLWLLPVCVGLGFADFGLAAFCSNCLRIAGLWLCVVLFIVGLFVVCGSVCFGLGLLIWDWCLHFVGWVFVIAFVLF